MREEKKILTSRHTDSFRNAITEDSRAELLTLLVWVRSRSVRPKLSRMTG